MKEYFVVANSFAAPICSDRSESYVTGQTPVKAMEAFVKKYKHPCGLFSANLYENADAFHKDKKPLARYLCNYEIEKQRITKKMGAYSFMGLGNGAFEINGEKHQVKNWNEGRIFDDTRMKK